jgi:sugar-specific transcriptional regulator TrmB
MNTRASFRGMNTQSAEFVVAHAAWQRSRGRNPSQPYLHIKDPKDALRAARSFKEAKKHEDFKLLMGDILVKNSRMSLLNMSKLMIEATIKSICASSTTAYEIRTKMEAKFDVEHDEDAYIDVDIDVAGTDDVSQQAVELVRALGGPITKDGNFVHVFFRSMRYDIDIMV